MFEEDGENEALKAVVQRTIANEGIYYWEVDRANSWAWSEEVWTNRLIMCLRIAPELSHIEIHPAFQWKGKNIKGP